VLPSVIQTFSGACRGVHQGCTVVGMWALGMWAVGKGGHAGMCMRVGNWGGRQGGWWEWVLRWENRHECEVGNRVGVQGPDMWVCCEEECVAWVRGWQPGGHGREGTRACM